MRALGDVVEAVRSGQPTTGRELRCAVAAFDVLLVQLQVHRSGEQLQHYFTASGTPLDQYLGPCNDPDEVDSQQWYRAMAKVGSVSYPDRPLEGEDETAEDD